MSARMVDSNITKLVWVPEGGIADISAPKVSELDDGIDLTCAVVAGYELGMTDSDTDNTRSVCDEGNVVNYTNANYVGNFQFFREGDNAESDSAYLTAYETFNDRGITGYWVRRIGLPSSTAWAQGQEVEVYKFTTDYPQYRSGGQDPTPVTFTVPFGQQGEFDHKAVVAS